jgi:hypothetical protein
MAYPSVDLSIDDYTRYAWVYFSHLKDAATVAPLIRAFITLIFTQFNVVIKRRRTDGGTGEFLNSLIALVYQAFSMIHQPSTPLVTQQNGAVGPLSWSFPTWAHCLFQFTWVSFF